MDGLLCNKDYGVARHVCPVWVGYFLASGLRKLLQDPTKILSPYVRPGMTVLDVGCAMGFFSLPMAEMVGPRGKVVCIDVQPKMLDVLKKRAAKAGLADRIETRVCPEDSLGLDEWEGRFDFAVAFAVLHEVPDQAKLFGQISHSLKPEARLLLAEPQGHVTIQDFRQTVLTAQENSLAVTDKPLIRKCHVALLTKPVQLAARRIAPF
jgi:2-polyprenyl-3-methyl-5-hydroxy-6-metoxy-1,4-benzoquinol methylase